MNGGDDDVDTVDRAGGDSDDRSHVDAVDRVGPTGRTNPDDSSTSNSVDTAPVDVFPEGGLDLRAGADSCYKCTSCDTSCPVAAVDDEFPGPKFQGPEQWRLKRKSDADIDPSITDCSNCMRCDSACPAGVPLSQMHNEARGEYVSTQVSRFSRAYVRNKLLSNYRRLAHVGSRVPRLTNFVMGLWITAILRERLFGITSKRELPPFAEETFRDWWEMRGGPATSKERAREARAERGGTDASKKRALKARAERGGTDASKKRAREARAERGGTDASKKRAREARTEREDTASEAQDDTTAADATTDKRVAYFHGCYTNYNTPAVGKAMVRVFEYFGYEVLVPPQRCSGTPMFANGMLGDARREAETNVAELAAAIADGTDVVASCTSCSLSLRQEYPELFAIDGIDDVAENTYEALEYLRIHEDLEAELAETAVELPAFAYHAPCHARNQGLARQAIETFRDVDGVTVEDVGDSCSGISGTYGWKAEKYDVSMAIGEEMFEHMTEATGSVGLTECPTCAMQMEHGTGYEVRHPLEVLEAALQ